MSRLIHFCKDCQAALTKEEIYFYEYRCEECEQAHVRRLDAFLAGADDPELEEMFGIPTR